MAYSYADWITFTDSASRLAQLRLHMQEVSELLTAGYTADGVSVNPAHLTAYYDMLTKRETSLASIASGVRVVRTRVSGL